MGRGERHMSDWEIEPHDGIHGLTGKHGPAVLEEIPLPNGICHLAVVPVVELDHRSRYAIGPLYDLDALEDGKVDRFRNVAAAGRVEV
jgi:hypothetical protein